MRLSERIRNGTLVLVAAAGLALGGCGDDGGSAPAAPKGSPSNPLVGKPTESSQEGAAPSYQRLLAAQESDPRSSFTPCGLVSEAEARAILGPVEEPLEAPQGPTCIYRSRDGSSFVTLALQNADMSALKRQLRSRQAVDVAARTAYCGNHGQPTLYLPLGGGRVLSVAGQCEDARRFAARALAQLRG
jgi:hypothetical protein